MKSIIKELKDWVIPVSILGILYFTGLHTEVAAFAQRMILGTGLITADVEKNEGIDLRDSDYDFTLQSLDGMTAKLSDFKGKVIFINVWATWCPPCIAELPGIQRFYYEFEGEENLAVIMLSMDKSINKPTKFIEKKEYTFPVYLPAGPIPEVFKSPSIPTTFVISSDGKILTKKIGMADYNTKSFKNFIRKQTIKN